MTFKDGTPLSGLTASGEKSAVIFIFVFVRNALPPHLDAFKTFSSARMSSSLPMMCLIVFCIYFAWFY